MADSTLTLADARRVTQAAVAKAEAAGAPVSVAVLDAHGNLVALERMDGCKHFMNTFAEGKAKVSVLLGSPSAAFDQLIPGADSAIQQALNDAAGGGLFFGQGAVPLLRDGTFVGAVGASGATSEQDEEFAQAGAGAL